MSCAGRRVVVMDARGDVVVGVDGSPAALWAAETAARLAAERGVGLHIASVARLWAQLAQLQWVITTIPPDFEDRSRAAARVLCDNARLQIGNLPPEVATVRVLAGDPVEELVGLCERVGAGTLVVGHCGITGPTTTLGRVALGILKRAPCPVLITRTGARGSGGQSASG